MIFSKWPNSQRREDANFVPLIWLADKIDKIYHKDKFQCMWALLPALRRAFLRDVRVDFNLPKKWIS